MVHTFSYGLTKLGNLRIEENPQDPTTRLVDVGGTVALATQRFWTSLAMRYHVSPSMFRYFRPDEVLHRVSQHAPDDRLRFCLEHRKSGVSHLLAVVNPDRPFAEHDEIVDAARRHDGRDLSYANGVVTSTHRPRASGISTCIGGDSFERRFHFEAPVDGFGKPKFFVSLLRMICSNGMVAHTKAFRSDVALGEDAHHSITRALQSFDDEEGYTTLHRRFESAQASWASVRECLELSRVLTGFKARKGVRKKKLLRDFQQVTGNLNELYGMADLKALSTKRQRLLPSKARVYDLLNFASEVATHHARPLGRRVLQVSIGDLIADEFDLEGTAEIATEFQDFFVSDASVGPTPSVN